MDVALVHSPAAVGLSSRSVAVSGPDSSSGSWVRRGLYTFGWVEFAGSAGNRVETTDSVPTLGTNTTETIVCVRMDDFTPSSSNWLVGGSDGLYCDMIVVGGANTGKLRTFFYDGTAQTVTSSTANTLTNATAGWFRQVIDWSGTVDYYQSADPAHYSFNSVTWTAVGTQQTFTPGGAPTSPSGVRVGCRNDGAFPLSGDVHAFRMVDNSTTVARFMLYGDETDPFDDTEGNSFAISNATISQETA